MPDELDVEMQLKLKHLRLGIVGGIITIIGGLVAIAAAAAAARWPEDLAGSRSQLTSKAEGSKAEGSKAEGPKAEGPKAEGPKAEGPKAESSTARSKGHHADLCGAAAGKWHLRSSIIWSRANYKFFGVASGWTLEVDTIDGCEVKATLVNENDEYMRSSARTAITVHDGELRLAADFFFSNGKTVGKRAYQVTFMGNEVEGGWRYSMAGALLTIGVFRGGRSTGTSSPSIELEIYGCATQCWVLCGSSNAARACVDSKCTETGVVVSQCGRPISDFEPPFTVKENLLQDRIRNSEGAAVPVPFDTSLCLKPARALNGLWEIHETTGAPLRLTLSAAGCHLSGTDQEGQKYTGEVDSLGAWSIGRDGHPSGLEGTGISTEKWFFMGWGPAFGIDSRGSNVAAYRG